ncbi:hypothetical protein V5O48_010236 [Marasmius crinis-equi]|uniref:HAD-like protein n=1 Tax=Marasmius crinis-equi TaxID=585013 RepID=A0ABR3F907_9AGAR
MTSAPTRRVEYVLFDLDGLMIDSEKVYTDVTNEILAQYGKKMSWEIKAGCMGKPERAAAEHLLSFFPGIDLSMESYLHQRNVLQDQRWPTVPLLPGVRKLIFHLKKHSIPIAVATGSRRRNYEMKTGHLGEIFDLFDGRIVCADDKQWVMKGKPEPDIFLTAARELLGRDVGKPRDDAVSSEQLEQRERGLVFEDALPGMQAGKRAGMSVVWIPDSQLLGVPYDGTERPDETLKSMEEFVPEKWGLPPYDP